MKFTFKAKNKQGELKVGTIDANNSDAAVELLQKNELFPLFIKEEKQGDFVAKNFLKYFDKASDRELMMLFKQLSILIEAKVPIVSSLEAIREQTSNLFLKRILGTMINDVRDGLALSEALQKYKGVFSTLAINIIKAGEISGNLKKSVDYVSKNIEKNYNLTNKVKSALLYPAIILVVFFVISFLVVTFIVPRITAMIKDLGVAVPWYTKAIIFVGDFMASYWWAVAIMIIGFVGGLIYYIKSEEGKREWHHLQLKLPIFGTIFKHLYIARFADNLNVLLEGGIPIVSAINLAGSVTDNTVYQDLFRVVAEEVKRGGTMSSVLKKSAYIPPIVSQMVKIGEESGEIDMVLRYVAEFYEQETDRATKNLATLIEPVMMIIIGIAVGFLVVSIIMPIYNIASQM